MKTWKENSFPGITSFGKALVLSLRPTLRLERRKFPKEAKADEPVLTEVTWESYNENVLNDPHVVLIQYYSKSNKDCTNCEAFQSQWKDLRDDLPRVKFAAVDVDTEAGNETALKTGALIGIPHLRLQYHGTDYLSLMDVATVCI